MFAWRKTRVFVGLSGKPENGLGGVLNVFEFVWAIIGANILDKLERVFQALDAIHFLLPDGGQLVGYPCGDVFGVHGCNRVSVHAPAFHWNIQKV